MLLRAGFLAFVASRRPSHAVEAGLYAAAEPLRRAYRFWSMEILSHRHGRQKKQRMVAVAYDQWTATSGHLSALRRAAMAVLAHGRAETLRACFARWLLARSWQVAAIAAALRSTRFQRSTRLAAAMGQLKASHVVANAISGLLRRSRKASRCTAWLRWCSMVAQGRAALLLVRRAASRWQGVCVVCRKANTCVARGSHRDPLTH